MNTGLGDAYDIGWKLAAVLNGTGGEFLLDSFEIERRPVAIRNVDMSGVHTQVHMKYVEWVKQEAPGTVLSSTEQGEELRDRIKAHVLANDGENQDLGIEMGYRNNGSPVVVTDRAPDGETEKEPQWNVRDYIPSTWPGARAPHVFLNDGETSIYDLFGPDYSLVDFTQNGHFAKEFATASSRLGIPLTVVHLPEEKHARKIWERDVVLVRPDLHVSWRSAVGLTSHWQTPIEDILLISTGKKSSPGWTGEQIDMGSKQPQFKIFTGTIGNVKQDAGNIELLAAFQK